MYHRVEKHDDLPIVQTTFLEGFSISQHTAAQTRDTAALIAQQAEPIYHLLDAHHLRINFDEIMHSLRADLSSSSSLLNHPRVIETLVIANNSFATAFVNGMRSMSFGNLRIKAFGSYDEARAYVRAQTGL